MFSGYGEKAKSAVEFGIADGYYQLEYMLNKYAEEVRVKRVNKRTLLVQLLTPCKY